MRKTKVSVFALAVILSIVCISCKKTDDNSRFVSYKNYTNLAVGKYMIYELDSTITRSFGTSFIVSSNIVKDSVVEEFTDNQGRTSFKVFRYLLDQTHNTWNPSNTFYYTPTDNSLEYIENNQRYIKLVSPITEGKSWYGNVYLDSKIFHDNSLYQSWNFYYKDVAQPQTVGSVDYPNTVTIVQYDSTDNRPFNPFVFSTYDRGYEIWADSIGLVYRDVISWEYQNTLGLSNCKHTFVQNGTPTTVDIDCSTGNCDSIAALAGHTIKCDTVVTAYHYNGFGTKQVLLQHN